MTKLKQVRRPEMLEIPMRMVTEFWFFKIFWIRFDHFTRSSKVMLVLYICLIVFDSSSSTSPQKKGPINSISTLSYGKYRTPFMYSFQFKEKLIMAVAVLLKENSTYFLNCGHATMAPLRFSLPKISPIFLFKTLSL